MANLWRNADGTRQNKYVVFRRDGTFVEWPYFVIGARDPAAKAALLAYADVAAELGLDPAYAADIRSLAQEFGEYANMHGEGDPDAPKHRTDNPDFLARKAGS